MDNAAAGREWLVAEWAARLAQTVESMADARPEVSWKPVSPDPAGEAAALAGTEGPVLWWEQSFSAAPGAIFRVGIPEKAWSEVGARILGAAGIEGAAPAETRGTFLELLAQSLESLANAMGGRLGSEVTCSERRECPGAPPAGECFLVECVFAGAAALPLLAVPGSALAEALSRPAAETPPPAVAPAPPLPPPAEAVPESKMLALLLDVELPVSISFGRTHLPLKEALKLTTGSIVELNRHVAEPVDVIVNNCVIARGEVVVIEGNYGVRIREIMSRQERLRNLR